MSGLSANRGGVERKDTGLIQQVDRRAKHDHSQRAIGGHDRDSRSWRRRKLGLLGLGAVLGCCWKFKEEGRDGPRD